jgi:hypothetical protein
MLNSRFLMLTECECVCIQQALRHLEEEIDRVSNVYNVNFLRAAAIARFVPTHIIKQFRFLLT